MDNHSVHLPCGRDALVQGFTGTAQKIINDLAEAGEKATGDDLVERLLAEVVLKLGDKRPAPKDFLAMPSGSRHRLLVEARRLAYGDELTLDHVCSSLDCGKSTKLTLDLAELGDVPYPADRTVRFAAGGQEFTLAWATGATEQAFTRARRQNLLGRLDEPLSRVTAVDGKPMGPQLLLKLPAETLDAVRRAGRCMVPTRYLPGTEEPERDLGGAVVTDPRRMPVAGLVERVQVYCDHCGHVGMSSVVAARDFLFRGTLEALDD